jgi:hypothetical protein
MQCRISGKFAPEKMILQLPVWKIRTRIIIKVPPVNKGFKEVIQYYGICTMLYISKKIILKDLLN